MICTANEMISPTQYRTRGLKSIINLDFKSVATSHTVAKSLDPRKPGLSSPSLAAESYRSCISKISVIRDAPESPEDFEFQKDPQHAQVLRHPSRRWSEAFLRLSTSRANQSCSGRSGLACMWTDMCNGGVEQQDSSNGRAQTVGFLGPGTFPELT